MDRNTILKVVENGIFRWKDLADYHVDEDTNSLRLKTKDGSEFVILVKTLGKEGLYEKG